MHLRANFRQLRKRLKPRLSSSDWKDLALTGLLQLKESSDALPPLKSAVGAVVQIFALTNELTHQRKSAEDLCVQCNRVIETLEAFIMSLPNLESSIVSPSLLSDLEHFGQILHNILAEMHSLREKQVSVWWRISHFNRTKDTLSQFRSELDDAERALKLSITLRTVCGVNNLTAQMTLNTNQHVLILQEIKKNTWLILFFDHPHGAMTLCVQRPSFAKVHNEPLRNWAAVDRASCTSHSLEPLLGVYYSVVPENQEYRCNSDISVLEGISRGG